MQLIYAYDAQDPTSLDALFHHDRRGTRPLVLLAQARPQLPLSNDMQVLEFRNENVCKCILTLSQMTILDASKLKEFADDNFKFDENGRKFSKRVENTVGKGEIARYEQFVLFSQFFPKTCTAGTKKPGFVLESVYYSTRIL